MRWLRRAWQRLTQGYTYHEVYEFHSCASRWMLPRLKAYRMLGRSIPSGFLLEYEYEPTDAQMTAASDKWDSILAEMIWALEFHAEEPEWATVEEYAGMHKRAEAGMKLMAEYWGALWS